MDSIRILTAEPDGDDGLVLTFSDGTISGFLVEELLKLRPKREPTEPGHSPGKISPVRKRRASIVARAQLHG